MLRVNDETSRPWVETGVDLAQTTLQPVTDDGLADPSADGQGQSGTLTAVADPQTLALDPAQRGRIRPA